MHMIIPAVMLFALSCRGTFVTRLLFQFARDIVPMCLAHPKRHLPNWEGHNKVQDVGGARRGAYRHSSPLSSQDLPFSFPIG